MTTNQETESPQPPSQATKLRAYADNVLVVLEPLPKQTASGLHIPQTVGAKRTGVRRARVVAVGPGHRDPRGNLIPTEVREDDTVLVDALAGQDYSMDLTVPRHNKATEWADERGEFRIIREDEILAVVEDDKAGKGAAA